MKSSSGFTLIELLVSMAIFSVLALGAYQMLQTVMNTHDRIQISSDSYTDVNLALAIIQRDFSQFVARPVRDEYGEPLPALSFESEEYLVEFTRVGWANPASRPRSRLQRVAYSIDFDEETVSRHFWEVLDRAEDSEPRSQVLLTGVTDFRVAGYAGNDTDFESDLGLSDVGDAAPLAVELVIATDALGEIQRVIQLTEPFLPETDSSTFGQGNNNQNPSTESTQDTSQ